MKINYPIPIRAKLVIIVLVFAIVPMLVLTLVWYNTSVERVAAVARLGLETRAQEIVNQLQSLKQKSPAHALQLADAVGPRTSALTTHYLPRGAAAVASIREVIILDGEQRVRYAANPDWEGQDYRTALPPVIAQVFSVLLEGKAAEPFSFPGLFRSEGRNRCCKTGVWWRPQHYA